MSNISEKEKQILSRVLREQEVSFDGILSLSNGGFLAQGNALSACIMHGKFDLIVLCAEELQRSVGAVHPQGCRAKLVFAPNDDAVLTSNQLITAFQAAELSARALVKGRNVLITCMQGRNRSGLVSALCLHRLLGLSGQAAADVVRQRRVKAQALTNDSFNQLLRNVPPLIDVPRGRSGQPTQAQVSPR